MSQVSQVKKLILNFPTQHNLSARPRRKTRKKSSTKKNSIYFEWKENVQNMLIFLLLLKKWMRYVKRKERKKSLDNNEELVSHLVIAEIEGRAATTSSISSLA